jgi:hypothetical protein
MRPPSLIHTGAADSGRGADERGIALATLTGTHVHYRRDPSALRASTS